VLLKTRPCPNCAEAHGQSHWKVAGSSLLRPLRCKSCSAFFHQPGLLRAWFCFVMLFPAGLFFALHWAIGLAAIMIGEIALFTYVNRKHRLVPGPKHG
jgi:hypothetical protein